MGCLGFRVWGLGLREGFKGGMKPQVPKSPLLLHKAPEASLRFPLGTYSFEPPSLKNSMTPVKGLGLLQHKLYFKLRASATKEPAEGFGVLKQKGFRV